MRRVMTVLSLAALLIVSSVPPVPAAGLRCRSDPLVVLTDGTIIDLSADIGALLWDIQKVQYTLHIPKGLGVLAVIRTPNWPTTKETFAIVSDSTSGYFDSTTVVYTKKPGADVTANLLVKLSFGAKSGMSGQLLKVAIKLP